MLFLYFVTFSLTFRYFLFVFCFFSFLNFGLLLSQLIIYTVSYIFYIIYYIYFLETLHLKCHVILLKKMFHRLPVNDANITDEKKNLNVLKFRVCDLLKHLLPLQSELPRSRCRTLQEKRGHYFFFNLSLSPRGCFFRTGSVLQGAPSGSDPHRPKSRCPDIFFF